jgi:hypothetical protein
MSAIVVDDFFSGVDQIRETFDELVTVGRAAIPKRLVWDYFFVDGQFSYIRTAASKVLPPVLHAQFLAQLQAFAGQSIGCSRVQAPWLSYYIDGCYQATHTDTPPAYFSYVFSITRWAERSFRGGETFISRPEDAGNIQPTECEPKYNRLILFDARLPHGVRPVHDIRDPRRSRAVLHGIIPIPELHSDAPLPEAARAALDHSIGGLCDVTDGSREFDGTLVFRCTTGPGAVDIRMLVNAVVDLARGEYPSSRAAESALATLNAFDWSTVGAPNVVFVPFRFGRSAR